MLNLYGGQGMGTAGMGVSGAGGMGGGAGGGMSLQQLLAMMQAGRGAAPMSAGGPTMTTPLSQGGVATPMANYIGGGMPGGGMGGAMPAAPVAGNPPPQQPGAAMSPGNMQGLMQLMAAMKGGQTGVTPQGAGAPGVPPQGAGMPGAMPQVPPQMAPGMNGPLASPGLDAYLRALGMFGGATGGAPT